MPLANIMYESVILQNIIAPYKTLLFNSLNRLLGDTFLVAYLAETAGNRDWTVAKNEIAFPFAVLAEGKEEDTNPAKTAAIVYRTLDRCDPRIVVVGGYNYLAYWVALLWAKKRKRKTIIIIESHYLDRPRRRAVEAVKRLFVSRFDAALVDGTRHRDYSVGLGVDEKNVFIKQGAGPVDVSFYQAEMAKVRPEKPEHCSRFGLPERNFIYVGRFSPEKNIMLFMESYRKLQEGGDPEWGLILVGDGPQKKEIVRYVEEHALRRVCFPGFLQKEDVPFFYGISDVLVLPSISEPWGLVVSEAMACGLSVIVSNRCGCYPDIVQEGINGFSFDPQDGTALLARMREFVGGKADIGAMGEASLRIVQEYTPEKAARRYVEAIQSVLRGGLAPRA